MGIIIDNKDYLSMIISSLPFSLSSFASAQLVATRMFASTKTIEPDVLMSLLMEEADRQRVQQVRCASKKGTDEDKGEALASEGSSKPRKGKGKENIRCWNCEEMGHYSHECKKPKKSKEKAKDEGKAPQGTSASAVEPDLECEGAWAAEMVEDAITEAPKPVSPIPEDLDWFEEVVALMDAQVRNGESVAEKSPIRDWFYEVVESGDESGDEGASSEDILVDVFGRNALERTDPEDSGITGQIRLICNDIFKGADQLSSTLLGPCQNEAPVAPADYPEGEYRGGGSTCESSGRMPDLDVLENPWIDDATMEWRNHAIVLQTVEVEAKSHPLGDHKGGDDPTARTCNGCCTEIETRPLISNS